MIVWIVTDVLLFLFLFLFFVFSPYFWAHFCLSLPAVPSPVSPLLSPALSSALPACSWLLCFAVSQLEVLHYRLSVSSALHSPAQPSLQALHAYQVLAALILFCFTPALWCEPWSAWQCSGKARVRPGANWGDSGQFQAE